MLGQHLGLNFKYHIESKLTKVESRLHIQTLVNLHNIANRMDG